MRPYPTGDIPGLPAKGKTGGNGSGGTVVSGSGAGRSRFPPFNSSPAKVSRKSELKHIGLCLLVCLPVCTTVCLIVDRLVGG